MAEGLSPDRIQELLVRFSLESVFVITCLLFAYYKCGVRDVFARIGRLRAKFCFAFFILFVSVQLVDRWQYHFPARVSYYPFVRFAMYQTGTRSDNVDSYRFEGRFDGEYREINLTKQFGAIGLPSINTRFRVISEKLTSDNPDDTRWAERQLTRFCESIAQHRHSRGQQMPDQLRFVVLKYDVRERYTPRNQKAVQVFQLEIS